MAPSQTFLKNAGKVHVIELPYSIQCRVSWIWSGIDDSTFVHLKMIFPDGAISVREATHRETHSRAHYDQVNKWLVEMIAEWMNDPYALAEQKETNEEIT